MALSGERSPPFDRVADLLLGGLDHPVAELLPVLEGVEPLEAGREDSLDDPPELPPIFLVGVDTDSLSILVVRDLLFITGVLPLTVGVGAATKVADDVGGDVEALEDGEIRAGSCGETDD